MPGYAVAGDFSVIEPASRVLENKNFTLLGASEGHKVAGTSYRPHKVLFAVQFVFCWVTSSPNH